MLRVTLFSTIVVFFLFTAIGRCFGDEPPLGSDPADHSGRMVIIEEDSWFKLLDEPTAEMEDALLLFHANDRKATARAMRKAAVYISVSAGRATPQNSEHLLRSSKELETLAADVEAGRVQSQIPLETAFARAHYALGRHHRQRAFEAWSKNSARRAGHYLRSATGHFQQAVDQGKRKLSETKRKTLRTTKQLAETLIEKGENARQRLGGDINRADEALREISEEIKPVPPDRR